MIASVSGTVEVLSPGSAVVDVGGVGVLVWCTPSTLARLRVGERARLATTLVVRETELTLYGFRDADERDVFEILQGAAGVGPRLAQAVLGVHSPDVIRRAVAEEDLATLTKVPGIGRKSAQRIVLDLRDRLGPPSSPVPPPRAAAPPPAAADPRLGAAGEQVRDALVGLGYSAKEALDAVVAARTALHGPGDGAAVTDGGDGVTGDGAAGGADPAGPVDPAALLRASLAVLRPR
ncbi:MULTISPECIES: Holliday junction branch migration protein RuvA [unclassified Parafrankia]|uniref:Holliday junction branch migration protein RuvA n=1 Tax=unclassified Parafrankia TaxID=2994368 RepID=UPI000DA57587|nr:MULTISPECIES: Holliday junction branch migration protein RuvA [unclassified Parafrankia]TCJ36193.1 Holliday junction branch migration protein RuvA [Parafrankia sp. BMG5.11]CAI7977909.1 Holliday junction ATP-dependent DNA helicase RuvA [Frankia sp. Hr75.2]SQE00532.1 Holliday junction ATP-dependent DNA helicase RuvA [Parafrankia sp. Ea1.12]